MQKITTLLLLFTVCCSTKRLEDLPVQDSTSIPQAEKPITLSFPEYGVFIHNWPEYMRLADHGNPCSDDGVSAHFMILAGSAVVGTILIRKEGHAKALDDFSPFSLKHKEKIFNGNLDLDFETNGDPGLKVSFANLSNRQEQFVIENLSRLPAMTDATVVEIVPERLPLYLPGKDQSIDILFDIKPKRMTATDTTSDFQLWFRNRAGIGGICEIDSSITGKLKTSLTRFNRQLKPGDSILIENTDRSKLWILKRTPEFILLVDKKLKKTKLQIPLSKNYNWDFNCGER